MAEMVDVAVIGAGHAGLNAIKEIRKVTDRYVLINGGALGTTCAKVGCMPSKVAVQFAELYESRNRLARLGIDEAIGLRVDGAKVMEQVRDLRDTFVDLVLANTTDEMGEELIDGYARFIDATTVQVGDRVIRARSVIIATGASTVVPNGWRERLGECLLTVENIFEQACLPKSLAVIGLGPIGVEIGQAFHRLGVEVVGIEVGQTVARVTDPIINQAAIEIIQRQFPVWLGESAEVNREGDRVRVRAGSRERLVDKVFVAIGRCPDLASLGLENIGCSLDARGVPRYDPATLRIGHLPVFIAGDATAEVANLQRAAEQGRIAGYNACHADQRRCDDKTPMSIVFSDPNIVMVGTSWSALNHDEAVVGQQRFGPVGRALIMGQNRGLIRLYADRDTRRVLGGAMIGPRCEHLAHLLAWGIQCGLTVDAMLGMPFYHPVIEEALQDALHDLQKRLGTPHRPNRQPMLASWNRFWRVSMTRGNRREVQARG